MSCLVIKNDGIGDFVLSSGIISKLSNLFNGQLDIVTCEENRELAEMIPGLRQIYYVSRDNLRFPQNGIHKPPIGEQDKEILLKIALQQYDVAICLRRFIRQSSLIIMNCVSAKEKHCCWQIPTNASWPEAEKYSKDWIHYDGDKFVLSELEYFWKFCSTVLKRPVRAMPKLEFKAAADHAVEGEKKVAIGLTEGSSKYNLGTWICLIDMLIQQGWTVHVIGGPEQAEIAGFIRKAVPAVIDHIGKLGISETLQLFSQFYYYIGNDTGISHMASLVIPKILLVLGGGTFPRFLPWPDRPDQHIIFHGLDCFDCDWACKYSRRYCIELVTASVIMEYFLKIINGDDVPRMINIGAPDTTYQLLWRRGKGEPEKISFRDLQKINSPRQLKSNRIER